ncbi:MAG TPA: hypothetical protein VFW68_09610 [Rhodocyclaceae bacterium]|nr:hypothetical protein [Rhodocyclaceae bacterium]
MARLQADFQPGVRLAQAESMMQARVATYSTRTAQECEALVKESRVATQLQPKGGPCIFGKLPISRTWYGGHSNVIFQLVFDRDGVLKDASFEAIQSM